MSKLIEYHGEQLRGISIQWKGTYYPIPHVKKKESQRLTPTSEEEKDTPQKPYEPATLPDALADWLLKNRKNEFKEIVPEGAQKTSVKNVPNTLQSPNTKKEGE